MPNTIRFWAGNKGGKWGEVDCGQTMPEGELLTWLYHLVISKGGGGGERREWGKRSRAIGIEKKVP